MHSDRQSDRSLAQGWRCGDKMNAKIKQEDFKTRGELEALVARKMYYPYYVPLVDPKQHVRA